MTTSSPWITGLDLLSVKVWKVLQGLCRHNSLACTLLEELSTKGRVTEHKPGTVPLGLNLDTCGVGRQNVFLEHLSGYCMGLNW
jgi:hypothetical protein